MDGFIFLYAAAIVLVGLLSTRLMKIIKMPFVTGYIITGIIMGPFVFGLFFNGFDFLNAGNGPVAQYVKDLGWVNNVALGFIAFSVGASFKKNTLKAVGKKVLVITVLEALFASLLVIAALLVAYFIWPDKIPLPLVLTLGAIAAATAPAATLMVVKQYRAKGPVTDTLLPVVALDDAAALILFAVLFQIAEAMATGSAFNTYEMFVKPLLEILISLAIGAVLGFAMSFACHFFRSRGNRTGWIIFVVFASLGLYYLFKQDYMGNMELSSLLTCMTAGAIYVNMRQDSVKTFEFLDRFTTPIYMLFFIISGANLNLTIFAGENGLIVLLIALAYVIFRAAGKWVGAFSGASISRAEPTVKKYLGFCLIPQAGVAIGLSTTAGAILSGPNGNPLLGAMVVAIILTSTLVYELVGPIVTKTALKKAGELTVER